MPVRRNERGAGALSTIIWLLVIAAVGYACWNVIPAYVAHYTIQDKMVEVCRLGSNTPDQKIVDMLMTRVNQEGLASYIKSRDFQVTTSASNRRIRLEYDRDLKILPGWIKMQHFKAEAEQPLAF